MSEDGDMWRRIKEQRKEKRWNNYHSSLELLEKHKIPHRILNAGVAHILVAGEYDFWGTTGKFINRKTKRKGRGVFKLIKLVQQKP